jgi:hypothetical protein
MRHATDADHIAAVASLATRSRSRAQTLWLGVVWGAGHTVTLLLFGGAVLMLGLVVPLQAAQVLEVAVGVMLVLLGADVIRRVRRDRLQAHGCEAPPHDRSERTHTPSSGFPTRALFVGMMHGMAGSAAIVLLSLGAMESTLTRLGYIAVFGIGSILGMALLSTVIAVPLRWSACVPASTRAFLSSLVGAATFCVGIYLIYQAGAADAVQPNWCCRPAGIGR